MALKDIGLEGVNRIHLAWDRDYWWAFVKTAVSIQVL
jgi:hypothetical protein